MDSLRMLIVPCLERLRQLHHALDRILLEELLIIQVIEKNVEPFLCVVDLCFEGCGGA